MWKWLKNMKQLLKSGCLALWGIVYFSFFSFFLTVFLFLKMGYAPKTKGNESKNKHKKA
jgi:hypothetical protein